MSHAIQHSNYRQMRSAFQDKYPAAQFHDTTGECVAHHAEAWRDFKAGWFAAAGAV